MAKTQIRWTPHHDPYEKAMANFSVSYMSNAKWFKTFKAIANANLGITRATWKFIESEHLHEDGIPAEHDLMPTRLADGRFQPFEYKWIEWIRFPRVYRRISNDGYEIAQDVDGLAKVLESVGQLQVDTGNSALTIYGHGR